MSSSQFVRGVERHVETPVEQDQRIWTACRDSRDPAVQGPGYAARAVANAQHEREQRR